MLRITRDKKTDSLWAENPPAARCKSGDTVIFETMDCYDGAVDHTGHREHGGFLANPATGPLYVEGAMPGGAIKVEILRIDINSWGAMGTAFGEGAFVNIKGERVMRPFDIVDGCVSIGKKRIPVDPMIGVIGVAPEGCAVPTVTPGPHGGNMDCNRIVEGAVIYFPVAAEGALLGMGDLHALMGDGEVFGYGLELPGEVTVRVSAVPDMHITQPLLYQGARVMTVASGRDLEEATRFALEEMYAHLMKNGWNALDAGQLMSMKCDLAICQIVDPLVTVRAMIDEELFVNE